MTVISDYERDALGRIVFKIATTPKLRKTAVPHCNLPSNIALPSLTLTTRAVCAERKDKAKRRAELLAETFHTTEDYVEDIYLLSSMLQLRRIMQVRLILSQIYNCFDMIVQNNH